jgi:hypothetical protein
VLKKKAGRQGIVNSKNGSCTDPAKMFRHIALVCQDQKKPAENENNSPEKTR